MIDPTTLQKLDKEQLIALIGLMGTMPTVGSDSTNLLGIAHFGRYLDKVTDPTLSGDYGFPDRAAGKVGFDSLFEDTFFGGAEGAAKFGEFVRSGSPTLGAIVDKFKELAPGWEAKRDSWNNVVAHFMFVAGNELNGADLGAYRSGELAGYGLPDDYPVTSAPDCNEVFGHGDNVNRGNAIRAFLAQNAG